MGFEVFTMIHPNVGVQFALAQSVHLTFSIYSGSLMVGSLEVGTNPALHWFILPCRPTFALPVLATSTLNM